MGLGTRKIKFVQLLRHITTNGLTSNAFKLLVQFGIEEFIHSRTFNSYLIMKLLKMLIIL